MYTYQNSYYSLSLYFITSSILLTVLTLNLYAGNTTLIWLFMFSWHYIAIFALMRRKSSLTHSLTHSPVLEQFGPTQPGD